MPKYTGRGLFQSPAKGCLQVIKKKTLTWKKTTCRTGLDQKQPEQSAHRKLYGSQSINSKWPRINVLCGRSNLAWIGRKTEQTSLCTRGNSSSSTRLSDPRMML